MTQKRQILVTSALPYANGQIHLGHLVEYIQTDIWVRFQKLRGHDCIYICADDTHGTPIMISAKNQGITPEQLIDNIHKEHSADFKRFHIEFDNYYTTNSPENKELSETIYLKAKEKGAIVEKTIEQYYSETQGMFLPDRFIKGTCPSCKAPDQYGDSCEHCSATYSPMDLKDPYCVLDGQPPVIKESLHYFFQLSKYEEAIKTWMNDSDLRDEIKNKLKEWFDQGLKNWDISRDAPYFGFKIPGTDDKYFYVWLDAPVGYIASTKNWCDKNNKKVEDYWNTDNVEIHHFIGKDILYFHTLFWPALLMAGDYSLPKKVNVHGFLTVNGEKMSKSRGTFILAKTYLDHAEPEFLRYYYAAKLTEKIEDLDLNLDDFVNRVNADIINKVVNIGSRLGSIIYKKCDAKLSKIEPGDGTTLIEDIQSKSEEIAQAYETLNYAKAMKTIIQCAESANKYIDTKAPWEQIKTTPEAAQSVCTTGLNALKIIAQYLAPVTPTLTQGIANYLNTDLTHWTTTQTPLPEGHEINKYEHLAKRMELEEIKKIIAQE